MPYLVSNCGKDENGGWHGGRAGDQTGKEYYIRTWYDYGQTQTARHPDQTVRETIARLARDAAENDCIGYDQDQRTTFWEQLRKVGYEPSKIRVRCEADCSSSTAAIVKATGHLLGDKKLQGVSEWMWTGNEREQLQRAGFVIITGGVRDPSKLMEGDIQFNDAHHTNIFVSDAKPRKLDVDGWAGPLTISEWQTQLGGAIDGVISGQVKTYRENLWAIESITWTEEGSYLVELVQRKCIRAGISCGPSGANGIMGPDTVKAIQKLLNQMGEKLEVDGYFGNETVKALQRTLNGKRWL